ncbi:STAS domain protein [compost metagenome]
MLHKLWIQEGQVNMRIKGGIYVDEATLIREILFPYIESGYSQFVFHFSEVTEIGSSGLGVMVAIQKKTMQLGGIVTIIGLQESIKEQFEKNLLLHNFKLI